MHSRKGRRGHHRELLIVGIALLIAGLLGWASDRAFTAGPPPADPYANETDPYWLHAKKHIDADFLNNMIARSKALRAALKDHKFARGSTSRKMIALTFDDGPHAKYTEELLAILKRLKVKATFFVVGKCAEEYPELVRAELADGHEVGNHTYHHVNLKTAQFATVATEIKACGEVLESITGKAPHLFRPPGGNYDDTVAITQEALGYDMILWTDDPGDYASPGRKVIAQRIFDHIRNGGVLLLHDGIQQTMEVLPTVVTTLQKQGYEFVTVDELIKAKKADDAAKAAAEAAKKAQPAPGAPARNLPMR